MDIETKITSMPCASINLMLWGLFQTSYKIAMNKKPDPMAWTVEDVNLWLDARTLEDVDGNPYISTQKVH